MLNKKNIKYSYNDVSILPEAISTIEHRSECNPYISTHRGDFLPIFAAPMTNVVSTDNLGTFEENKIIPIVPRSYGMALRQECAKQGYWVALSLAEYEKEYCNSQKKEIDKATPHHIVIDVANGHMKKILDLVSLSKKIYKKQIVVMAGNVANPKSYYHYYKAGVDYIRSGIGGGLGCITSTNTATHCPMVSLIDGLVREKQALLRKGIPESKLPKIVADGGIRNYSDIIKALAIGADFVMAGSIFAQALESAAHKLITTSKGEHHYLDDYQRDKPSFRIRYSKNVFAEEGWFAIWEDNNSGDTKRAFIPEIIAEYYGMASSKGQIDLMGIKKKTSEGTSKKLKVTYTLSTWAENMSDYLRSTMSYTNSRTLKELAESEVILISASAKEAINK